MEPKRAEENFKKDYGLRSAGARLLMVFVPVVTLFLLAVAFLTLSGAKKLCLRRAEEALKQESRANAAELSDRLGRIAEYYDALAETLEHGALQSDESLGKDFSGTLGHFPEVPAGFCLGFSDGSYLDVSGWHPEEGFDPREQHWYREGLGKSRMTIGELWLSDSGQTGVSMSREISLPDGRQGVLSIDVFLDGIAEAVSAMSPCGTGEAMLLDGTRIVAASQPEYAATLLTAYPKNAFLTALGGKMNAGAGIMQEGIQEIDGKYVSLDALSDTGWTMVSFVGVKDALSAYRRLLGICILVLAAALLIIVSVMEEVTARVITAPAGTLGERLAGMARGEFVEGETVPAGETELGDMLGSTRSLISSLKEVVMDARGAAEGLGVSAGELYSASGQISAATDEVSEAVSEVSKGAAEQADTVRRATENIDTLSDAISQVAGNAEHLAETALAMNEASRSSADALRELTGNLRSMGASVAEISESMQNTNAAVLGVNEKVDGITSIAAQTNLLALNASIEAARAGAAGRGFAVVAVEIGQLAKESADTADEIREEMERLLKESRNAMEKTDSVSAIGENVNVVLERTVGEINDLILRVETTVSGIREISGLAGECDASRTQIVDAMASLSAISEQNEASTKQTSASVEELNAMVSMLSASAEALQGIIGRLNADLAFFRV